MSIGGLGCWGGEADALGVGAGLVGPAMTTRPPVRADDSDSDPDNPGEDSSSNTSADDSMTGGKTSQCSLRGGEVKEVSRPPDLHVWGFC